MKIKNFAMLAMPLVVASMLTAQVASAKTVNVTMHAIETDVVVNSAGDKMAAFTFDGTVPGNIVRVTEGDTVDFTLINDKTNKNSHAMDFHAAVVHVLDEFAAVKPGEEKHFKFEAKYPGVFMYHCGASPMVQHIAKGMYGVIIVDPKEGYSKAYPKPDREYVMIQQQYFPNTEDVNALLENKGWTASLINGRAFKYDPVHDPKSEGIIFQAKPGERVRIFFVNANINNPVAFHPIAGVWDRVYLNGNPKNVLYGIQTQNVAVAEADVFDIVSPKEKATANAIVDHAMGAALRGAITVLINSADAPANAGKDTADHANILPRTK